MHRRRWLRLALLTLLLLAVTVFLPACVGNLLINQRIQQALDFPATGYVREHPALDTAVTIRVASAEDALSLDVQVTIDYEGDKPLQNVIGAAKLDDAVSRFCQQGRFSVQMYEPVTVGCGSRRPLKSFGFSRQMPLCSLTEAEKDQLAEALTEPVRIKLVHDRGVELLLVQPQLDLAALGK